MTGISKRKLLAGYFYLTSHYFIVQSSDADTNSRRFVSIEFIIERWPWNWRTRLNSCKSHKKRLPLFVEQFYAPHEKRSFDEYDWLLALSLPHLTWVIAFLCPWREVPICLGMLSIGSIEFKLYGKIDQIEIDRSNPPDDKKLPHGEKSIE